jgi:hypothetical protein
MNAEIETKAPIFLFWEYLLQIFGILSLQYTFVQRTTLFRRHGHLFTSISTVLSNYDQFWVKFREEFSSCSVSGNLEGKWEQMHAVYKIM